MVIAYKKLARVISKHVAIQSIALLIILSPVSTKADWIEAVYVYGWMNLLDDDGRTNVTRSFPIRRAMNKRAGSNFEVRECVGGEVWARIRFDVLRVRADSSVDVSILVQLYEGTSCSTSDLEGTSTRLADRIPVSPNAGFARTIRGSIQNREFRSDDHVMYRVTISNVRLYIPPIFR